MGVCIMWLKLNKFFYRLIFILPIIISMCIINHPIYTDEPALPKGLSSTENTNPSQPPNNNEPTLPQGLSPSSHSEPQLPQGLQSQPTNEPQLPQGLGQYNNKEEKKEENKQKKSIPFHIDIKGFWDNRAGIRYREDRQQSKDLILGESRLQLRADKFWDKVSIETTGDFYGDFVQEELNFDLRQARLTWTLSPTLDLRIGRQILTWGTGDQIFINDLFPKDWNSFFVGREQEYLKAPSDSIKLGWYPEWFNFELVYTPRFTPDRYITGDPITFWNPLFNELQGEEQEIRPDHPGPRFHDDEWAFRAYRKINNFEFALYAYSGRWKSPGGQKLLPPLQAYFPKLNVYGTSLRGPVGKGILSLEMGYYDSKEDRDGSSPFINNSEFRFLVGYEQELAKDFTGAFQVYLEHMLDYENYESNQPFWVHNKDENRLLTTIRLTRQLMNQNLILSWFMYYSPTDQDFFLRPNVRYKINDKWWVEGGANIFIGNEPYTFFGQFMENSNIYIGARCYF